MQFVLQFEDCTRFNTYVVDSRIKHEQYASLIMSQQGFHFIISIIYHFTCE